MIDHSQHRPVIAARMPRRAGSKVRRRKRLVLLLSGLILIGAIAPAAADRVSAGKTKSSQNVLEELSEMLQAGFKDGKKLTQRMGDGTAKASLPIAAKPYAEPKQVIRSSTCKYSIF